MKSQNYEVHRTNWRGIQIEIAYQRNWLATEAYSFCHLTITSEVPARCPLPITETGFLSHFTDPAFIDAAGGPVAFVIVELDAAAKSQSWIDQEMEVRQLALF